MNKSVSKIFNVFVKLLRFFVGDLLGLFTLATASIFIVKTGKASFAFMREGVYASSYIIMQYSMALVMLSLAALFFRFGLGEKLRDKIGYKELILAFTIAFSFTTFMFFWDEHVKGDFKWRGYVPYVETMPSKSTYAVRKMDYSYDTIELRGYFSFLESNFKNESPVELVQDDNFTDNMRVEVYYRGVDSEINLTEYDDSSIYINMWEKEYTPEMSIEDLVYMYKYKVDIKYADKFVVEKIVIRTAYPEKLDIENLID